MKVLESNARYVESKVELRRTGNCQEVRQKRNRDIGNELFLVLDAVKETTNKLRKAV